MNRHSGGGGSRGGGAYRNPCITMHQPWASLLVHGIKRVEGRSWPAPLTGRLWIHAAGKVPDPDTIRAMEAFYRQIYAVNGITDIKFPDHYPISRLVGCVEVVGCVRSEELICWEDVPESVRLEGLTEFCWLCEQPQKLVVPFEMRGYQRVYNLERKSSPDLFNVYCMEPMRGLSPMVFSSLSGIAEAAVRGLYPVKGPLPVSFPLPDPHNPSSLKPGSLGSSSVNTVASTLENSSVLIEAIAGARAAATQFSKKNQSSSTAIAHASHLLGSSSEPKEIRQTRNASNAHPSFVQSTSVISKEVDPSKMTTGHSSLQSKKIDQFQRPTYVASRADMPLHDGHQYDKPKNLSDKFGGVTSSHSRAPSKLFTAAVKDLGLMR